MRDEKLGEGGVQRFMVALTDADRRVGFDTFTGDLDTGEPTQCLEIATEGRALVHEDVVRNPCVADRPILQEWTCCWPWRQYPGSGQH